MDPLRLNVGKLGLSSACLVFPDKRTEFLEQTFGPKDSPLVFCKKDEQKLTKEIQPNPLVHLRPE